MRIDQKPPTLFTLAKAKEYAETLTNAPKCPDETVDGWTYKVIKHVKSGEIWESAGVFGEVAVYDFDGEYLGSF